MIAGVIVILGLFQPWLWRGYEPWSEFNPRTKKPEIHYHVISTISPLFTSIIRDGRVETTVWFMDLEASLAGVILIVAAVLGALRFRRRWISLSLSIISFMACLFFFLSLGGRGLGIGSVSHLGWGFKIAFIGLTLMFFSSLAELLS